MHHYHYDEDLLDIFHFIMGGPSSSGSLQATSADLEALIKLCLVRFPGFLLLDAIDECDDAKNLIGDLLWLSSNSATKILVFGRTNIARMNRTFPEALKLGVDRHAVANDIHLYLTSRMEILIEDDLLPAGSNVPELVACLSKGADGMFLWARLMINYLNSSALTPLQRRKTILEVILPEGLDQMYRRITQLIAQPGRVQLNLARQILTWAAFSAEPLTIDELHDVLTFKDSDAEGYRFTDFQETVSVVCGGLVECYSPSNSSTGRQEIIVRCIHLSVKEHFSLTLSTNQIPSSEGLYLAAEPAANLQLMEVCFEYLSHYRPIGHDETPRSGTIQGRSFARYASQNWPSHFCYAFSYQALELIAKLDKFDETAIPILHTMIKFLENPHAIKSWIEMFYSRIRHNGIRAPSIHYLASALHTSKLTILPQDRPIISVLQRLKAILNEWTVDIDRLVTDWGERLIESPGLIWDEVPAFLESKFIGTCSKTVFTSLGSTAPQESSCSSKPLCAISKTAPHDQITGVLTIWPSKTYEECWESYKLEHYMLPVSQICHGWIAKYEVWRHENERQGIVDVKIPLCPGEIATLLRQSSRTKDNSAWGISFPLAISNDLFSVMILRTLYSCQIRSDGTLGSLQSALVSMDFDKDLAIRWTTDFNKVPGDWYSYEFTFSPNDNYLFFWDWTHFNTKSLFGGLGLGNDSAEANGDSRQRACIMAVFEISGISSVNLRNKYLLQGDQIIRRVVFHQLYDFVALGLGLNIVAWNYLSCKYRQSSVCADVKKRQINPNNLFSCRTQQT